MLIVEWQAARDGPRSMTWPGRGGKTAVVVGTVDVSVLAGVGGHQISYAGSYRREDNCRRSCTTHYIDKNDRILTFEKQKRNTTMNISH